VPKDFAGQRGIAFLRDQLRRIVRRELIDEEEISGGDSIFQQLNPLANKRGDGQKLLRQGRETSLLEKWLEEQSEPFNGQRADVLGVKVDCFRVEGRIFRKVDDSVGAVDAFKRESGGELVEREDFAIVFRRPAEQAEKIDEGAREKPGVAVGGDADDRAVLALGELCAVGRNQQRKMRELRRGTPRASKISRCLKVLVRWSWPRMMWLMRRSASSTQEARW